MSDAADQMAADVVPDRGKESASTVLVNLAMDRYEFHVSDAGETFAVPRNGGRVVRMLRGGKVSLRGQLSSDYFRKIGKAAPQQALADALLVIEGMAQEGEAVPLHLRVARHGDALWLDLGDQHGRAVRITGTGWEITGDVPVLFKRTALTSPLPDPEPGGDMAELWQWLNITTDDQPLIAAWLVAALDPDMPHPILGLFGEQGTAKTTAEKVLVSVLDPSPAPTRKPPRDADAWMTAAAGSWVVGLDNLSGISEWLSDTLCRAVTGDGDVRRKLYADRDIEVFAFRRALVITGIDIGASRGDLAERMLPVDLDVISEAQRIEERELWPRWSKAHPLILGAVLDLAARVIATAPTVSLPFKPRMADFARILAAVDDVLDTGRAGLDRYRGKQKTLASDSLTGDAFVTAIAETLGAETFQGTSAELLAKVRPGDDGWRAPKDWPANARAVTTLLKRQVTAMRKAGWTAKNDDGANHSNAKVWTLTPPPVLERTENDTRDARDARGEDDQRERASVASVEYGPSQDDRPAGGTLGAADDAWPEDAG